MPTHPCRPGRAAVVCAALAACRPDPAATAGPGAPPSAPAFAGPIGTAHALVLERVAPDGRWLFYCQARRDTDGDGTVAAGTGFHGLVGDAFMPYLHHRGRELELDAFLDATASGRYLLVDILGQTLLIDTEDDVTTPLPVANAADPYSFASRASFNARGTHLVYARSPTGVVVRELASGHETVLDHPGLLWRAWFDDDDEHVWAEVVTTDTNGDGELSLPQADTNLVVGSCRSPVASSTWGAWYGDRPVRLASRDGKALVEEPGALLFFAGAVLARTADGALELRGATGNTPVAGAACQPMLRHVDRGGGRFFFMCQGEAFALRDDTFAPLYRFDAGGVTPVGAALSTTTEDLFDSSMLREDTSEGARFDWATGAVHDPAATPNNVVASHDGKGLVILRSGEPCIVTLETGARRCMGPRVRLDPSFYGSQMHVAGPIAVVPIGERRAGVVDLAGERVLGFVADRTRVHGAASDGRLLVGAPAELGVIPGPLRWAAVGARR